MATVSRVLNDEASVSSEVREKVRDVARRLDYGKPQRRARKTRVVGLIVPDILNPFFPLLTKGIENVSKIQGYHIIFCDSEDSLKGETENIDKLLDFEVEGMVVVPSVGENRRIDELVTDHFPLVLLDRMINNEQSCTVSADNLEGAYQAVKYLINMGHRRILHLAGPANLNTGLDRLQGYQKALQEAGIEYDEQLVINGGFHFSEAYEETRRTAQGPLPFTAIFSANDTMAFGAFQALKEAGIDIPGKVSLVGYDDIPFASTMGLTTVAQPIYEMGRNAMIMLLDLVNERIAAPQQIVLRPSMVLRSTCQRIGEL
ncbi:MAG: LacI family DNA-binding transcriptional regulator [Spirochaetales bacterium]|nr:LacI family DNA-binding transcriptional regulator [Spirochaetales bacterium]